MSNTIILTGRGIRQEGVANGAITPGDLIEMDGTGASPTVARHSTAASNAVRVFAVENEVVGKEMTVDYATGDNVLFEAVHSGQTVQATVAAAAPAIVRGDFLESAGDGTVRVAVADTATDTAQREAIVAVALEDVDNSGGGAKVWIRAMVV